MNRIVFLLTVLVVVIIVCAGCSKPVIDTSVDDTGIEDIKVAVSILPQARFVEKIGGDKVKVQVMIPPGASPVTYEPTPTQLKNLSRADMYVRVKCLPFEKAWMGRIKSANDNMHIIDSSMGIKIINKDPHIWLSPVLVKKQVEHIYQGLAEIDPQNKDYYKNNKERYVSELEKLDREIKNVLSGISNKKFIVFHPCWGYFAREYGLKQIPVKTEGKKLTPRDITRVVDKARSSRVKVIIVSPQHDTKSSEVIAREIEGEIILANPLAKDYIENIRHFAGKLSKLNRS
ncbi:MAG: zinc ABC transporter substrate-binding protein [Clostridiales bacterium]|nr:zinc ABC transporter substrate-binding protein [Clostridiales bacterium]MCF8021842.1 zinc ABC transporter substrate-binding protein [Clostridiales bacterium]